MLNKVFEPFNKERQRRFERNRDINFPIKMKNFFELKNENLKVFNQYDFLKAEEHIKQLSEEEIKDSLNHFQKKNFQFKNKEENIRFSLDEVEFATSSKNEDGENDYYLLNDLNQYLISDENFKEYINNNDNPNNINNKITLEINKQPNGKKNIFIKCLVDENKFAKNILEHFLKKSSYNSAKTLKNDYEESLKKIENGNFKLTIKIQVNSINKIYYNLIKGEFFFELQNPPIFKTNFLISGAEEMENNICLFPFRNFEDEISNLKYRNFIVMIKKSKRMGTDEIYLDDESNQKSSVTDKDSLDNLNNTFKNLFNSGKGKDKLSRKNIIFKKVDKNMLEIKDYFNYEKNTDIKKNLKKFGFLKKVKNNEINDEEVIKFFYQVLALVSENILSYYNAVKFMDNFLKKGMYKSEIFSKCKNEDFPKFFNITLTKILDKYQNSLEEKTLEKFEEEIKNTFRILYAQYESEGLEEVLKPSKNEILMRVQRCVITPTYILFTPYVLEEGNRILRDYSKSLNYTMLCGFKMDSLEEARWNNKFLMEYIKFIMSTGFMIGEKRFRFFNYSQSQFRNMSCWLLTNPEEVLSKIGDFSGIKQLSKYAARVSQTLTTTLKTVPIKKDLIKDDQPDVKSVDGKYTFSDGVGKISYKISKQISEKLNLNYVPSCFQGRFLGCKGVWTTMWDDDSGEIYCRKSQIKFKVEKKEENYFEVCDYSRYIQSYLNRQIILLLNSLGIPKRIFIEKLFAYQNKLNDSRFVLSLVHYPEWNRILQKMNSCGINKTNDRLIKAIIESNLDLLYNDIKKKARIYIEDSAYVIGIMDEYNILNYGEAYLHIKRDNLDLILDQKCAVAKCPCLHPGDIRVLTFKKYREGDESTKKYEIFNRYENVVIFPSKGKRPHPDECSGSDLDGDNYFIFYDKDLVPKEEDLFPPMSYLVEKKEEKKSNKFSIKDVIQYFAEYTNLNNLGIIGDAHLALSDKYSAKSKIALNIAKKFSKAVDAPKTGDTVTLSEEETPQKFPHFMGKTQDKSYHSNSVLGKLYDLANDMVIQRIKKQGPDLRFYDGDLKLNNWENFAFLSFIYYRDYFTDFVNLLKKNEISGESVLLTGNNIDNEKSILSKKKHNYDLREKIGNDMHNLFIVNRNNFYEAIENFFINKSNKNQSGHKKSNINIQFSLDKVDLINATTFFSNQLHLFASACYIISYNLIYETSHDKIKSKAIIENYSKRFSEMINDNLIMENTYEELNDISEYESESIGIDSYLSNENSYDNLYVKIDKERKIIEDTIDKKKNDMIKFIKEIKELPIPKKSLEENQYRILSFPWCISGEILANLKFLNMNI